MKLNFRNVDVVQVYVKDDHDPFCFYNIDDAVDFVVTYLHEFYNDDEKLLDEFSVMKNTLKVYAPEVPSA